MKKLFVSAALILAFSVPSFSQQSDSLVVKTTIPKPETRQGSVYRIKPWIDIPATVVLAGLSLNGMRIIYGRDTVPVSELQALSTNDINSFDRPNAKNYDTRAKSVSDLFFYGSMPLPLFLMIDPAIRKDGLKVGLLYLQAMGATGTIYTTSAMAMNRFRPYAYNPNVAMETRQRGGARNSFYAGHVAVVGTSTFFMAKVYSDYHPEFRHKWVLYTVAGSLTAATAYLRVKAGQHFTTDAILGSIMGAASGILIPHIHKNKDLQRLTLSPNYQNGQTGFTAVYRLNRD
jgi:membrane-associated phospholipid phosphatase